MRLINKNEIEFVYLNNKKVFIGSYGFANLEPEISSYQEKVFKKYHTPINQYVGDVRHPEFMDKIIREIESDYYVFFDIDCIPLKENVIQHLIDSIGEETMIGIEQQCNSKGVIDHIYAGPACFAISSKFYNEISQPSFNETYRGDVGEELTYVCEALGKEFKVLPKFSSDDEIWSLKGGRFFGHGTTYGDGLVYHQFEIRNYSGDFIKKCKKILNEE